MKVQRMVDIAPIFHCQEFLCALKVWLVLMDRFSSEVQLKQLKLQPVLTTLRLANC